MTAHDDLITNHPIVSHEEWLAARRALLEKEKEFTRQSDELSRARNLPWEGVTKEYVFEGRMARKASRSLRRPKPARGVSLHVPSGRQSGLPALFTARGRF